MNKKTQKLAFSAIMLAMSIVLNFIPIYKMPMGGEVTLLSMLPICFVSVRYGLKQGLFTSFVYSLFQLVMGIAGGNVFVYTKTISAVTICVVFDYLVPFTALGLAGVFRKKGNAGIIGGVALAVFIRFVCHYVTGVVIWGQWAENMSKYLYSLIYNGQYMLPELILTCIGVSILVNVKPIRKMLLASE
ncbi:MAG: energy-coupled thiamine transporter ThiT [Clostridia bacterium]|nr:energy-coupled thiamine transporter ThiT [Clostridia bacterium]